MQQHVRRGEGDVAGPLESGGLANTEALSGIALVPAIHTHLTCDLPRWMFLGEARLPFLATLVVFVWCMVTSPWAGACLVLVGLGVVLAIRAVLRRCGLLSSGRVRFLSSSEPLRCVEARLVCCGDPNELRRIEALSKQFFEPILVSFCPLQAQRWLAWGALVVFLGMPWLVRLHVQIGVLQIFALLLFMPLISWLLQLCWPAYYRVSPGHLDILSFRFLRLGVRSHVSVSLADCKVCCRFDQRTMTIEQKRGSDGADQQTSALPLEMDLAAIPERHKLVEAVFKAALCERSAPSLPVDTLLG